MQLKTFTLYLALFCSMSLSLSAQNFVIEGKTWNIQNYTFGGLSTVTVYEIRHDTVVDNQIYKTVYRNYNFPDGDWIKSQIIREDEFGDVYFRRLFWTEDLLLHKGTMNVGDTYTASSIYECSLEMEVTGEELITLTNGETVKRYNLIITNMSDHPEYFIEGVGYGEGLFAGVYWCGADIGASLICVADSDEVIYQIPDTEGCMSNFTSTQNLSQNVTHTLSPNPFWESSVLNLGVIVDEALFCVFDINGRLLFSEPINYSDRIVLKSESFPSSGMYFYSLIKPEGVLAKGKVVLLGR